MANVKRPMKFKLDAYRMHTEKHSILECFKKASEMNDNISLSGCMTTKAYAYGYMSEDIKGCIRRKLATTDIETHQYFEHHQLSKQF